MGVKVPYVVKGRLGFSDSFFTQPINIAGACSFISNKACARIALKAGSKVCLRHFQGI